MKHEACFQLGTILKKAGNDGKLHMQLESETPEQYLNTESVFLEIHGKLVPFFIEQFKILNSQTAHLKLEDVDDAETAGSLTGSGVFLPLEMLPVLSGKKFYYFEVIGFSLINDADNILVGTIESIYEQGMNDLFILKSGEAEILVPIAEDWIIEINREKGQVRMDLPEGLISVNSAPSKPDA
jgi:16S rRNA processing protein RimM